MKYAAIFGAAILALGLSKTQPPHLQSVAAQWTMSKHVDALSGKSWQRWVLLGKYLVAPRGAREKWPSIVVDCQPGRYRGGHERGEFLKGFIDVGAVVASHNGPWGAAVADTVELRLDQRKPQDAGDWDVSTDYSSVSFSGVDFDNLLYGHLLLHKAHTTPPVKTVIVRVQQYLSGNVGMEFEMPDPQAVADACGAIWHKKATPKTND